MIDYTKVTDNEEIIKLIKKREKIENRIRAIDKMALVRYELECLYFDPDTTTTSMTKCKCGREKWEY